MNKHPVKLYKTLAVGVIILFVGVGIQPVFAVNISTSISNDKDDCGICPKVSKQHIDRLKILLDRLENYENILPLLSKHNSDFKDISDEVSSEILDDIISNGIIWNVFCKFLINFVESIKEFRDKYFGEAGYINWWLTVISFSTYLFWKAYCPNQ